MLTKEKEKIIFDVIMGNMSEEEKDHIFLLVESHKKSIESFREGNVLTLPSIEIKFIQIAHLALNE